MTKLGRGLSNVLFCFIEYGTNIQKAADQKGYASGFLEGAFTGTCYAVGRILSGVYDVATFLVPIPEEYQAIMKPDYVFGPAAQA